jgi:serine/threonine protein kinase
LEKNNLKKDIEKKDYNITADFRSQLEKDNWKILKNSKNEEVYMIDSKIFNEDGANGTLYVAIDIKNTSRRLVAKCI